MSRVIDARGKACPTPVILGKKALEEHYRRMGMDAEVQYTGIFIMQRRQI